LDASFEKIDLQILCWDKFEFRPVYDSLSSETPKEDIINLLVEYADQRELIELLLNLAKEHNLVEYEKYYPYYIPIKRQEINPYIAGDPIDDPDLFFGREELINKIIRGVVGGNHQAVQGPRRSGKSSLLNELTRRLRRLDDPKTAYVPVKFNCQSATQVEFFFKLMRSLRKTINEMYPTLALPALVHAQRPESYTDSDFEDDLHAILEVWREAETKTLRIILLLDEGDTINLYDPAMQGKIRTIISDNKVLKMVWVGTNILEAAKNVGSPWYNLQITHLLPPLAPEDAHALMLEPAQKLGYTFHPEAVEHILALAQGQPYIVQYLCHYAVDIMLAEQRSQISLADVEAAIAQLGLEKSAQDVNGVVYQARVSEEEPHLTLAEKPNLYHTSAEEDQT
jgi:hypothetical protein